MEIKIELTHARKVELYERGDFAFNPPPVPTALWDRDAWIRFIDADGEWSPRGPQITGYDLDWNGDHLVFLAIPVAPSHREMHKMLSAVSSALDLEGIDAALNGRVGSGTGIYTLTVIPIDGRADDVLQLVEKYAVSVKVDRCEECGYLEPGCMCECINCGATMEVHHDGRELIPGTDCPLEV